MPVIIKDEVYYRTKELCQKAKISRSTLLRWLKNGVLKDASYRDRRGWRLFSNADFEKIEAEANKLKQRK
jgi:excisionase family DNA binding protein